MQVHPTAPAEGVQKFESSESVLSYIGLKNCRIIFVALSLTTVWLWNSMLLLTPAFSSNGVSCPTNESQCRVLESRFTSLASEFHVDTRWFFSIFVLGACLSSLPVTFIADKYGRKKIVVAAMFFSGLFGCLTSLAKQYPLVLAMRFLQGFSSTQVIEVNLAFECITVDGHGYLTMVFGLWWVVGYCVIALVAYISPDWRSITLITSLPCFLAALYYHFAIPESFHFIVEQGKQQKVDKWIKKTESKRKSVNCDVNHLTTVVSEKKKSEESQSDYLKFFYYCQDLKFLFLIAVTIALTLLNNFLYGVLSLYSTSLVGNPYVNFILTGVVEIPANILIPLSTQTVGRKMSLIIANIMCGGSLMALYFVSLDQPALYVTLWLVAKANAAFCTNLEGMYFIEVFPTSIRCFCQGIFNIFTNIAYMLNYRCSVLIYALIGFLAAATSVLLPSKLTPQFES